ncbi:MAG: glycerophosphodiester phosphodiesterase [Polyangiaceae bacterium]|nr:glycerophosphodiester phosphodiesterase [Polyangiaceae bacterium]
MTPRQTLQRRLQQFIRASGARPKIFAHRGARAHAPENTIQAFALAKDHGADGIELDVRQTRCGILVVSHDEQIRRPDGRRVPLSHLNQHELPELKDGRRDTLCTLCEALEWAADEKTLVNIELKADLPDPKRLVRNTVRLLRQFNQEPYLFSSFSPGVIRMLRQQLPASPTSFLFQTEEYPRLGRGLQKLPLWRLLGAQGVHPANKDVSRKILRHQRVLGRGLVNVWTVNRGERARKLAGLGVDGLFTDDPQAILKALEKESLG